MLNNTHVSPAFRMAGRAVAFTAMVSLMAFGASSIANAQAVYIINDGETSSVVETKGYIPSSIVKKAGIEIEPSDRIEAERNENGTMEINIIRSQNVTINYMGSTLHTKAYSEPVDAVLRRMNIDLGEEDIVSVDLSKYTTDGMVIDVTAYTYGTAEAVEPVTFTSKRIANASMTKGKEVIKQEGRNGSAAVTYSVKYENGVEVDRTPVSSKLISAPTIEIVEYGTKAANIARNDRIAKDDRNQNGSGVLTFKSGDTLSYSRVLTTNTTAYTARSGARTASGKVAYVGGVAVDPKVIPLGSKLYITTADGSIVYGMATAVDTGGAIKGNKLDLYYSTYNECVQFGRRNCTVYVLN